MGHRTKGLGHWARAQPQKARGPLPRPARFVWLGPGPMAQAFGPMSYGLVLCPMALFYVLWPCPMSYGRVLCGLQALCEFVAAISKRSQKLMNLSQKCRTHLRN